MLGSGNCYLQSTSVRHAPSLAPNFRFTKMATESGSECIVNLPLVIQVLSVHKGLTEFIKLSNDKCFYHGSFVDITN